MDYKSKYIIYKKKYLDLKQTINSKRTGRSGRRNRRNKEEKYQRRRDDIEKCKVLIDVDMNPYYLGQSMAISHDIRIDPNFNPFLARPKLYFKSPPYSPPCNRYDLVPENFVLRGLTQPICLGSCWLNSILMVVLLDKDMRRIFGPLIYIRHGITLLELEYIGKLKELSSHINFTAPKGDLDGGWGSNFINQIKDHDLENSFETLDIDVSNIMDYDLPENEFDLSKIKNLNGRSIYEIMQSKIIFWNININLNNSLLLTPNYKGFGSNFILKSVYVAVKGYPYFDKTIHHAISLHLEYNNSSPPEMSSKFPVRIWLYDSSNANAGKLLKSIDFTQIQLKGTPTKFIHVDLTSSLYETWGVDLHKIYTISCAYVKVN